MGKNTDRSRSAFLGHVAVGAIVSAMLFGVHAGPAGAEEATDPETEAIAQQVAEAAPDNAAPVHGVETDTTLTTLTDGTSTVIPLDAAEPLIVGTSIDGENVEAEIVLPEGLSLESASVSASGTVVFPAVEGESDQGAGTSLAVQALEGGDTRIQTVIHDSTSDHEYTYAMNGYQAIVDDDGNASFVGEGEEALLVPVEPAWAVDANGLAVATHYIERDGALMQIIEPTAQTAYPIVADPTWGWRNAGYGLTLSRSEVNTASSYSGALGICSAIASSFKAKGAAIGCGGYAGYLSIQASTANRQNPKGCLHVVLAPVPGALLHVRC